VDSVNDDCLHLILSHLPYEDLNSLTIMSRRYRKAQSNPKLDQTRSGTIVCTEGSTVSSVFRAIEAGEWDRVFTGIRTHLRIEGITRLTGPLIAWPMMVRLTGVTSADLSHRPFTDIDTGQRVINLCRMLPNVREIDLSYVRASFVMIAELHLLTYPRSNGMVSTREEASTL